MSEFQLYDGLLIGSGPSLVEDMKSLKQLPSIIIACNVEWLKQIKPPEAQLKYICSLDCPKALWNELRRPDLKDWHLLCPVTAKWIDEDCPIPISRFTPTSDLDIAMMPDSWPYLTSAGVTLISALHFLVVNGCQNIFGAGVTLEVWHGKNYYGVPCSVKEAVQAPPGAFEQVRYAWNRVRKYLKQHGVRFSSRGLVV